MLHRYGRLTAVALAGSLALAACGSDNNTTTAGSTSSASGSAAGACSTGTLTAEGSSAQKNAIEEAIASYNDTCSGATINYNPTGSGAGIKQFNAGQVDFAGSDSALNPDKGEVTAAQKRCKGSPAWNLPMVVGPIAIAYHVPGVSKLVLTPSVAAKIFQGDVKTWNDPAIAAVNKGIPLPAAAIKVFFRSDESGTTENFLKYLKGAAPSVSKLTPGKSWPGKAGEGREKSSGVAEGVKGTANSITYVEWSYARDNKLGVAQVDNGAGPVELTGAAVGKAVAAAQPAGRGNDLKLKLDYATKVPGAYPVLLVTYEIACAKGLPAEKTALLKSFLSFFASAEEQRKLETVGYAPLPAQVATKVAAAVKAIS